MQPYPQTKTPPWNHQVEGLSRALNFPGYYLAHDMGCGKSKTACDFCTATDAKLVLIVCPKKVIGVWPRQFGLHCATPYRLLALVKGTANTKAHDVKRFILECERLRSRAIVITNYDTFWRPPLGPVYNEKNRITNPGVLAQIPWDLLIADEAHRIKSPSGRASWGMTRLATSAKRRLFLSGTPLPHSPLDVYAQFRAMDSNIFGRSFSLFRRRYCEMGGFENRQVVSFINQDELQRKFFSRAHRVAADDVLDLPDTSDIVIECDLDPKTLKIYQELENEFISQVEGGIITVQNALDKLLRLSQIASGTLVVTKTGCEEKCIETIDNSKIETALEIIEDLPRTEPVVIFCRFREELRRLTEMIADKKKDWNRTTGEISGRMKPPEDFIGGVWQATKTDTLLVQIQAGGEGLDFTKARYCIYLSMGFSLGQYDQSKARVRRPGQTRKTFYYHILAKKTVDKKIMKAIMKKREIVDYILKKIQFKQAKAA